LIAIGPVPNIAAALEQEPRIAGNARFVGMHGSVRLGYACAPEISAEWNVAADAPACRAAFAAPWHVTVTPLDTCGLVRLAGGAYARVRDCADPLVQAVIENYRVWASRMEAARLDVESTSSTLFDTVAVYLAFAEEFCVMEDLGLRVTDDGYTLLDESAKPIRCATAWRDLPAFEEFLVARLTA
ncbi:MAG: nucleoside hydrolase, partial [Anaerolineae bacterium]|nr:nucleoside hydrolase [Anaerolineae bacterium]